VELTQKKSITIIGGGLAGLTLAIGIRQHGVAVSLYEAGGLPRHRVCGEFICGKGLDVLRDLGLQSHLHDAIIHNHVEWYRNDKKVFGHPLLSVAGGISRHTLDQRLADTFVQLGGTFYCNHRVRIDANEAIEPGRVFCNGRKRTLNRQRWLGMKIHIKNDGQQDTGLRVYLGNGCYVGVSAIENDKLNLCGLFQLRPDVTGGKLQRLCGYLKACGLNALNERLIASKVDETSFCAVTALDFNPPSTIPDQLTLGDQFGMIAPFTGNGMSIALESAQIAVAPLVAYASNRTNWSATVRSIQEQLLKRFSLRIAVARRLQPLLLNCYGQTSLGQLGRWHLLPLNSLFKLTH
jgi:flavin-dependent dehydrogenase